MILYNGLAVIIVAVKMTYDLGSRLFATLKARIWRQAYDNVDVLHRTASIPDGHPSRMDALSIVADTISGEHDGYITPNTSAVAQPHDDSSLFGHASIVEDREKADIMKERSSGRVAAEGGTGKKKTTTRQPDAKLTMNDFGRVMSAGWLVLSSEKNILRYTTHATHTKPCMCASMCYLKIWTVRPPRVA
jgi:hypothetical protein